MILFPNCKINIGLDILRKRPDGYHDIETVMYPLYGLYDGLEIIRDHDTTEKTWATRTAGIAGAAGMASKTANTRATGAAGKTGMAGQMEAMETAGSEKDFKIAYPEESGRALFTTSGLPSGCTAEENLVVRAYELIRNKYGIGSVRIHLHKNIPLGAGLGGGSSDAAFTIKALNSLFGLGLTDEKMEALGAQLGSDVPFFIRNSAQLCSGRGEIMAPVDISLQGKYIAVIASGIHVSTAEAYRGATPHVPEIPLSVRINSPMEDWRGRLFNAFEETVFAVHPQIELLKTSLYSHGAVYASMTGSGSAVYGIFDKEPRCLSTIYNNSFIFRI